MRHLLPLAAVFLASLSSAQSLDSAYAQAKGRVVPPAPRTCWTRGASAAADAAGMPLKVCVSWLKAEGTHVNVMGTALLAGGAQTEPLAGGRPMFVNKGGRSAWSNIFVWEAGKGEFDEESVVQLSFGLDVNGAVIPGTEVLTAFHQCPERGCSYACGMTSVEFKKN